MVLQLGSLRCRLFADALAPVRPLEEGVDRGTQRVDAGSVRVPGQRGTVPLAGLGLVVCLCNRVGVDLGRHLVTRVLAQVGLDQAARLAWMPRTETDRIT